MNGKPYHHGDLRRALIETGIDFIKQKGEEALSLRKIAEICGVSNAAPYAHFKSKDEFIVAIQKYIMDLFAATLEKTETRAITKTAAPCLPKKTAPSILSWGKSVSRYRSISHRMGSRLTVCWKM